MNLLREHVNFPLARNPYNLALLFTPNVKLLDQIYEIFLLVNVDNYTHASSFHFAR